MTRVVIDTNIFVASLFEGKSAHLIDYWLSGVFTLCLSEEILDEYFRILSRFSFRERLSRITYALEKRAYCLYASDTPKGRWVPFDPDDDKFIACALSLRAEYIVSSDHHLKALGLVGGARIVTPGKMVSEVLAFGEKGENLSS